MAYSPLIPLDQNNTGSQSITHTFEDIASLGYDEDRYANFYFCNAIWRLAAEKEIDNRGVPHISFWVRKVKDEYESCFSYEVQMNIILLSTNSSRNVTKYLEGNSPKSRFVFGLRSGECMGWGFPEFETWGNLLNPQLGFVDADCADIEVNLNMTLVKVLSHKNICWCKGCNASTSSDFSNEMVYLSLMDLDANNTGSQLIRQTFENIRDLQYDEPEFAYFYFCNVAWKLEIEKKRTNNGHPQLSIFLFKVDDDYENSFSYEVQMAITLISNEGCDNITERLTGNSPRSRFVFGLRRDEDMGWGFPDFISWDKLLNPQLGFVDYDDYDIEIELNMTLVRIYRHKKYCQCPGC